MSIRPKANAYARIIGHNSTQIRHRVCLRRKLASSGPASQQVIFTLGEPSNPTRIFVRNVRSSVIVLSSRRPALEASLDV
jgi:hypothetical protein